jgi:hypothetical protein
MCVCIILVFVSKQAFWQWRFPNMGIEGVELRKTDKRQKRIQNKENQNKIHKPRTLSCQYQHVRDLFS